MVKIYKKIKPANNLPRSKAKLKSADEVSEFAENIIDTVREPLLVLDKELRVIKASYSFYDFFKVTPIETIGTLIYDLGNQQWDIPKLRELLETILPERTTFDNYEVEHNFSTIGKRIMLLNARQIQRGFGKKEKIILLAIEDITERRLAEKLFRETNHMTNEYLDVLFNHAHVPIIIWDSTFVITHFNHAFEKLSGYDWTEVVYKKIDILFPKDKVDLTLEFIKNNLSDEKSEVIEIEILTKDNDFRTVLWNSVNIFDEKGKNIVATIAQDITKRKKDEEALIASEHLFQTLTQVSPVGIFRTKPDGYTTYVNPRWSQLSGLSFESALGDGWLSNVHPEDKEKLSIGWQESTRDRKASYSEYRFMQPDGTIAWVMGQAIPEINSENQIVGYIGTITDITERKRNEETLTILETRYRRLFETAKDGIIILDAETGKIVDVNPFLIDLLGYSKEKFVEKEIWEIGFFKDIAANKDKFLELQQKKYVRYENLPLETADGRKINVEFVSNVYLVNNQKVIQCNIRDVTERIRVEKALLESEERYRQLVNLSPDAIVVHSESRFVFVNPAAIKLFGGKNSKDILGKPIIEFVHPDFRNTVQNRVQQVSKGQTVQLIEEKFIQLDGTVIDVEVAALPFNYEGKPSVQVVFRDITEHKRAEEALLKLKKAVDNSGEVIFLTDKEGIFTFANPAFTSIYGYTADEIVGKATPRILKSESLKENDYKLFWESLKSGKEARGELINKRKDGTLINIESSSTPIFDEKKNIIGFLGIQRDITERKHAEEEIVMLAHSLRSINECVSITDMEDKIIFANESFLKTYGYDENELIGKHMSIVRSLNNPHELVNEILPSTIRGGWSGELWNKRKDGSEFLIYLSTTIINDKKSKPLGLIGVAKDITEFKRAENELIESKERAEQSDKLKSEFLAQMSHEIRTPLNAIVGNVDYLNQLYDKSMDTDTRDCFDSIGLASKRIIRTVDLILNTAELQTSGYRPHFLEVDLDSEILKGLYIEHQISAKQKGLEIIYICKEKDTKVIADGYSITQVFSNLIDNAIKYSKKGKVEIMLRKNKTCNIVVEVKDTGIGISKKFLPRIFEPFSQEEQGYTRSFEGNGLGLALVKKYCDINNAIIEVESKKNVGSTFRIIFNKKNTEGYN